MTTTPESAGPQRVLEPGEVAIRSREVTVGFSQHEGEPDIEDLVSGLRGVCHYLDREPVSTSWDWETMNVYGSLATAAKILANQLADRITGTQRRNRRLRRPKLRAIAGERA